MTKQALLAAREALTDLQRQYKMEGNCYFDFAKTREALVLIDTALAQTEKKFIWYGKHICETGEYNVWRDAVPMGEK